MIYVLWFNALIALASSLVNFAYYFKHANGKSKLRLLSGVVLLYFAMVYISAALGLVNDETIGPEYLRTFIGVLFLLPVWDTIADWKRKTNKQGG